MKHLVVLILIFSSLFLWAQDSLLSIADSSVVTPPLSFTETERFEQANTYYNEKHYDSAEVIYWELLEEMGPNSTLYYNLSNCAYRQNNVGEAILLLERALLYNQTNVDISTNLAYLRTQTVDKIEELEQGIFIGFIENIHVFFPLNIQFVILFGLSFVITALIAVILFSPAVRVFALYFLALVLCIFTLIAVSAGIKIYVNNTQQHGIVLTESVDAMNEPRGTKLIFTAHEGTRLTVLKKRNGWYSVSLPNGVGAWIPQKSLGLIEQKTYKP